MKHNANIDNISKRGVIKLNVEVNFVSVFAAAIAFMALGFLWYSKTLFGKIWAKEKGYSDSDLKTEQKKMGPLYGLIFLMGVLTAYVLFHIMAFSTAFYGLDKVTTGLQSGFWIWLGFIMPTQVGSTIFGSKNWKLFSIDTLYQLTGMLLMGTVIGYFS